MRRRRGEDGFTLIETIVVAAIVALAAGALGTFFLAGTTPAVASAGRDVAAAFDEARRAAIAFDAATVVFAPARSGGGFSARIYARTPGDPGFQPRNGPAYESAVTIGETASPLGAPGFAFAIDAHGTIAGFANFSAGQTAYAARPCPASGAFTLRLAYARDTRTIAVPCALPLDGATPVAYATPPAAYVPSAAPSAGCPAYASCAIALLTPPAGATCPPGYSADASSPGLCDAAAAPAPTAPSPTCPPAYTGTPPLCSLAAAPAPGPVATPPQARCVPGPADALGFATCLESNPIAILGSAITHAGCGTRTPIADPGASIAVIADVVKDGALWGSYALTIGVAKTAWLEQTIPPTQTCGLPFALAMRIAAIVPVAGNAASTPSQDTGDPALALGGAGAILAPPLGGGWGTAN